MKMLRKFRRAGLYGVMVQCRKVAPLQCGSVAIVQGQEMCNVHGQEGTMWCCNAAQLRLLQQIKTRELVKEIEISKL